MERGKRGYGSDIGREDGKEEEMEEMEDGRRGIGEEEGGNGMQHR